VRGQRHDDSVSVSSTNNENALAAETNIDTTSTRDANPATSQKVADNLWEVAGKKLEEKHRLALDLENAPPITESIDDVIKTTEEKYREYKEGGVEDSQTWWGPHQRSRFCEKISFCIPPRQKISSRH